MVSSTSTTAHLLKDTEIKQILSFLPLNDLFNASHTCSNLRKFVVELIQSPENVYIYAHALSEKQWRNLTNLHLPSFVAFKTKDLEEYRATMLKSPPEEMRFITYKFNGNDPYNPFCVDSKGQFFIQSPNTSIIHSIHPSILDLHSSKLKNLPPCKEYSTFAVPSSGQLAGVFSRSIIGIDPSVILKIKRHTDTLIFMTDKKEGGIIKHFQYPPTTLCSASKQHLVTYDKETLRIIDLHNDKILKTSTITPNFAPESLQVSKEEKIITLIGPKTTAFYDIQTDTPTLITTLKRGRPYDVDDLGVVWVEDDEPIIHAYDPEKKCLSTLEYELREPTFDELFDRNFSEFMYDDDLCWISAKDKHVVGITNRHIYIWDRKLSKSPIYCFEYPKQLLINSLDFDGRTLVAGCRGGNLFIADTHNPSDKISAYNFFESSSEEASTIQQISLHGPDTLVIGAICGLGFIRFKQKKSTDAPHNEPEYSEEKPLKKKKFD